MDKKAVDKIWRGIFTLAGLFAVISVLIIAVFIFVKGTAPFFRGDYSFLAFISGTEWYPGQNKYGVFYMLVGSLFSTIGACILAIPIGLLTAIFIVEFASPRMSSFMLSMVELLSGIPSVLFGVFGLGFFVPWIMKVGPTGQGQSMLAVIIVLTMMILPIIISLSVNALKTVPQKYVEASFALGASHTYTVLKVNIVAVRSALAAGFILGVARALGETMAVMLVAGNPAAGLPSSLFSLIRPLTTNIALEMSYSVGLHQEMLFATGVVLFFFIIIINLILNGVRKIGNYEE